jgi:D-alanyl-D-alanine carboxypeptidase (penicillin-binding protein 5/6)
MTTTDKGEGASGPKVHLAETSGRRGRRSGSGRGRGAHAVGAGGVGNAGRRHSFDRRRRRWPWAAGGIGVLLVGGSTWAVAQRINAPFSPAVPHANMTGAVLAPGSPPVLPWPSRGQGAVVVPSLGFSAQSGPEFPVSIASLTKIATAVVILNDHPIAAGAAGPVITVTSRDVAEYQAELHLDQSSIEIQVGETLTERQMLEALMIRSANDIAYSLAVWDAGSVEAFVAKMNALAASLGATNTHYVDASGFDSRSVSSAADVLKLASEGMAIPTFAEVVALPNVTLPLVGTLDNIVPEVGTGGVIGIKSGYTFDAGACMVLAGDRIVQGRSVLVIVAVLGQPTPPPTLPKPTPTATTSPTTTTSAPPAPGAPPPAPLPPTTTTTEPPPTTTTTSIPLKDLPIADPFKFTRPVVEPLLTATRSAIVAVLVATKGALAGSVISTWGGQPHSATYAMGAGAWLPGWPGQQVKSTTRFVTVPPGASAGATVGTSVFAIGSESQVVPLRLTRTVPEPSIWWRLAHTPCPTCRSGRSSG